MNTGDPKNETEFEKELAALINKHSYEQHSDTPDFILAEYLVCCLRVFNLAMLRREGWYGRGPKVAPTVALTAPPSVLPPGTYLTEVSAPEEVMVDAPPDATVPVGTRIRLTNSVEHRGALGTVVQVNGITHIVEFDGGIKPFKCPHYFRTEFEIVETQPKE